MVLQCKPFSSYCGRDKELLLFFPAVLQVVLGVAVNWSSGGRWGLNEMDVFQL
jgi:hypothetical protein